MSSPVTTSEAANRDSRTNIAAHDVYMPDFAADVADEQASYSPALARFQTLDRRIVGAINPLTSGQLRVTALWLPEGAVISNISAVASAAAATPTNQWAALLDQGLRVLGKTVDRTTEAWNANTLKTFNFATPVRAAYSGIHYVGLVVVATTVPQLTGLAGSTPMAALPPILTGSSSTGLTNPASLGATAAAITAGLLPFWAAAS
jgi:hypothetical protein